MSFTFQQLNPHSCKTYLVGPEGAKDVVLIDPVLEHLDDYLQLLDRQKLTLVAVVDTHTHADHISGAAALRDQTGCEYMMHKNAPAHCINSWLSNGSTFHIGDIPVEVLFSPGHTRDSVCLIFPDRILTGDTLFLDDGGAGRDDLPGGDPEAHWESLERLLALPDHLVVYPAHDYRNRRPSSLKHQKETNPHLQRRTKQEFTDYLQELKLGPAEWMNDVLKANYACARDPGAAWIPVDSPACEVKGTLEHGVNDLPVATISHTELRRKIDSDHSPILLDVRGEDELKSELGHLDGILNIPIVELSKRLPELEKNKNREIVTICRSGGRSHTAAQILTQAGFTHVFSLAGGMIGWRKSFPA